MDIIDVVPPAVDINMEVKHRGMATDIERLTAEAANDVLVSSFDPAALVEFDDVATALLFEDGFDVNLDVATELGCNAIHPHYDCCSLARVEAAHDRGFKVNAWSASRKDIERLRACGVDGRFLDRPIEF